MLEETMDGNRVCARKRKRESEHGNKLNDRTMCSYSMASEWNKAFSQIVCIHGKSLNYMHCTMYNIYLYHTEHTEYNNANKIKTCSTRVKWAQQSSGGKKHQKLKWYSIRQLVVVHFLEGPSYRSVWLSLSPSLPRPVCACAFVPCLPHKYNKMGFKYQVLDNIILIECHKSHHQWHYCVWYAQIGAKHISSLVAECIGI